MPAHFPRDEIGLRRFDGTPCYEHQDPRRSDMAQWGTVLFDFGRGEACSFLMASACYWLEWFHADGLRCDAVSAILYHDFCREPGQWVPNIHGGNENLEGAAFLKRLNTTVYGRYPGVMMIAEESTAYPRVTHPVHAGGLGFGFKWNMGWMNDMLSYIKLDPVYRKYHHDKLTFSLMYAFSENYILPFSHDEVVHGKHSMLDKNPGDLWQKFAGLRMLLGYQLCHPGKKLNFMGTEFAHFIEWKYEDQLDWFLLVYERHPDVQKCVRALNALYRSHPALWQQDDGWAGFTWLNADDSERSILSFLRWDRAGNALMCVTNFTPACYADYRVGLPAYGYVKEALNTDDPAYGGSGKGNPRAVRAQKQPCGQFAYSASIAVPPLSTVIYTYTRPQRRAKRNCGFACHTWHGYDIICNQRSILRLKGAFSMKSKLSRIAAFVMCLLLTLSVAAFALAETTGDAAAAAGAANPEVSPVAALLSTFVPMVLIVVVFWLFLIRPQRKKDKKIKEMLAALKVGDRVCTIGGIYGTITNIRDENTITLAVGPQDVPVVFARWAIRNVEEITVENDTEVLA